MELCEGGGAEHGTSQQGQRPQLQTQKQQQPPPQEPPQEHIQALAGGKQQPEEQGTRECPQDEGAGDKKCGREEQQQQQSQDFIPDKTKDYLSIDYWERRFETEEEYEWCKDYSCFRHLLLAHVRPEHKVLVLGCGNSRMSECLCRDGIPGIVSTDLSSVVVHRMRQRCQAQPDLASIHWAVADMLDLPFPDASFDVVVEKGALDVFFVDNESPWDPSPAVRGRVHRALGEAHRVLKPTGTLVSISFGQPHFRRPLFESDDFSWAMQYETFGEAFHYFFFHLTKGSRGEAQGRSPSVPAGAPQKFDLEHEWMDTEDFMSHCHLGDDDVES